MTLNGRNDPLAEVNKNSGAHQKNFNDRRHHISHHTSHIEDNTPHSDVQFGARP